MSGRRADNYLKTGAALALLIGGITIAGIFFLPRDYNAMNPDSRFLPPGRNYPMGTDNFGRNVFYRVMAGAKYTLLTALVTVAGSAAIGSALGMFSGFSGGLPDEVIIRLLDILASFPGLLLALLLVSLFGNRAGTLVAALLILFIPGFTRIMRNGMLRCKNLDFVLSARAAGISYPRIIFLHIFPNLIPSLLSTSVLGLSNAILAESTMSYLGLGIQPPVPSWGRMLAESQTFLFNAPWCALVPGLMIILTVLAFHYLGEGLNERALQETG
jgi:peptide/nickel transport system permease protein